MMRLVLGLTGSDRVTLHSLRLAWPYGVSEFNMTLDTLGPSAWTGSGFVHLCGLLTVEMYEDPVARHRHPPLKGW